MTEPPRCPILGIFNDAESYNAKQESEDVTEDILPISSNNVLSATLGLPPLRERESAKLMVPVRGLLPLSSKTVFAVNLPWTRSIENQGRWKRPFPFPYIHVKYYLYQLWLFCLKVKIFIWLGIFGILRGDRIRSFSDRLPRTYSRASTSNTSPLWMWHLRDNLFYCFI